MVNSDFEHCSAVQLKDTHRISVYSQYIDIPTLFRYYLIYHLAGTSLLSSHGASVDEGKKSVVENLVRVSLYSEDINTGKSIHSHKSTCVHLNMFNKLRYKILDMIQGTMYDKNN